MNFVRENLRSFILSILVFCLLTSVLEAQEVGGIRGMVYDRDFDVPLAVAQVLIVETGEKTTTTNEGNYLFGQVRPGTYTLVFSKEGYTRQLSTNVIVSAGQMTEVNMSLPGEFTEMEEFIVQDLELGAGTETEILDIREKSPELMSGVSQELLKQSGAGDAAQAVTLVAGATVQEGKYAVVRGLPDRYVSSQLNGMRLPTADADKRAVELDQFPTALIESIQVSKTFAPYQQGDASGGAVNVVTKGVPEETTFQFSSQISYNSQVTGRDDFLTYRGGGVSYWGFDDGGRDIQTSRIGENWNGAAGVSRDDAPVDYKWTLSGGGRHEFDNDVRVGGFGTFFYERDSSFRENAIDDKYWVENPGDPMSPQYGNPGTPTQGNFKTSLFDITQGVQEVKWGGLGTVGLETENHALALLYLYTHVAEDKATLAEDTRGKAYYFRGYNRNDPNDPGNQERDAAPYLRAQTLEYTERTTHALQLSGHHTLPDPQTKILRYIVMHRPEVDWRIGWSFAGMKQPDKRQFGSVWYAEKYDRGFPPYIPPSISPAMYRPFKAADNYTLGNFQRVWKEISEESQEYVLDLKMPFEQWSGEEGYLQTGLFYDTLQREYNQDSFSNFSTDTYNNEGISYQAPWGKLWSDVFSTQNNPITDGPPYVDVDYDGEQTLSAWYFTMDMPINSSFHILGGARFEKTELSIVNYPEQDATWIPLSTGVSTKLNPGDADVSFAQSDVLPSIGFKYTPIEKITIRGAYSQTVARQTFKELSPIKQVEYLGGDVFVGNPTLGMSELKNYDLRLDYTPYDGGLVSLSYFYKDIKNPIEYVQRVADVIYTTPVNYPKGWLSGYEFELRQNMERFSSSLDGLSIGANATFIDSEVTLSAEESAKFSAPNINVPISKRDMTGTPEHLYNFFLTYDLDSLGLSGTHVSVFYTITGDTLVAGAGQSKGHFIPDVYAREYGTLNMGLTQQVGKHCKINLQAKNLTDPEIQEVYRSDHIGDDVVKTSYKKGIDLSLSMSYQF